MVDPISVRRDDFVSQLQSARLDTTALKSDYRMLNVDVDAADLDHDGAIAGDAEVGQLFDEVNRLDKDRSAMTVMLAGENGKGTAVAAPMAAIGDLGNAPDLQHDADVALPGISAPSGRAPRTGIYGVNGNTDENAPGGRYGPTDPRIITRRFQVQTIRNTIGAELQRSPPDNDKLIREMNKLGPSEAARFARDLRLEHPDLHRTLVHAALEMGDEPTRATLLADEPALSEKILAKETKALIAAAEGNSQFTPWNIESELHAIPAAERALVLKEIQRTRPELIPAFRNAYEVTENRMIKKALTDNNIKYY